jgi:hypothetical protein
MHAAADSYSFPMHTVVGFAAACVVAASEEIVLTVQHENPHA